MSWLAFFFYFSFTNSIFPSLTLQITPPPLQGWSSAVLSFPPPQRNHKTFSGFASLLRCGLFFAMDGSFLRTVGGGCIRNLLPWDAFCCEDSRDVGEDVVRPGIAG